MWVSMKRLAVVAALLIVTVTAAVRVPVAPKHFSFVMSTNGTTSALDHKRSTLATCTENCDQRWPGGSHCMDCSGVPPYVLDLGVCVVSQQSSWSCCGCKETSINYYLCTACPSSDQCTTDASTASGFNCKPGTLAGIGDEEALREPYVYDNEYRRCVADDTNNWQDESFRTSSVAQDAACASGGNATTANGYECAVLPDYQTSCDRSRAGGVMCTETQTITQDGTTFTFKRPRCFSNMCNNNNAIGDYEYFATKHTRAWCDTNGYTGCSVDYECPASGPPVILIIGIVIVVGVVVIAGIFVLVMKLRAHPPSITGNVKHTKTDAASSAAPVTSSPPPVPARNTVSPSADGAAPPAPPPRTDLNPDNDFHNPNDDFAAPAPPPRNPFGEEPPLQAPPTTSGGNPFANLQMRESADSPVVVSSPGNPFGSPQPPPPAGTSTNPFMN